MYQLAMCRNAASWTDERGELMTLSDAQESYAPMSETAYYILLVLTEPRHGYGIMQYVEEITDGRLRIGPGTLYGTLSRMQQDGLIESAGEQERRKLYAVTDAGRRLLGTEIQRLRELLDNGMKHVEVDQR